MKINFNEITWEVVAPGLRVKKAVNDNKQMRLLEFSDEYDNLAWCEKGHSGFVLEGRFSFIFDNRVLSFKAGEAFIIAGGAENRHRTHIEQNEKAVLFVVEEG